MAEQWEFPARALDRLAHHVARGDVVFFIGAGLSVDSEKNTASRLVQRLLLRLLALSEAFALDPTYQDELKGTFELKLSDADPFPFGKADVDRLSYRYYETNEWFCGAFARILQKIATDTPEAEWPAKARRAAEIERRIHQQPFAAAETPPANPPGVRPDRLPAPLDVRLQDATQLAELMPALLGWTRALEQQRPGAWRHAGKAFFLDTLGFRDPLIMAGSPKEPLAKIVTDYAGRLLPRHHVLARFAREGLCTTTLTANYDLLLEGAFRLAGFAAGPVVAGAPAPAPEVLPATTFADYARIASPVAFFSEGKAHRTPVLVKMHGCVQDYRGCGYSPDDAARLLDYLPSMVFTYREIQNWRKDSWAADFLRTLLRTRTVVFAGYSLQDPVIHDTLRTVYEEMAEVRAAKLAPGANGAAVTPERAPAFFFAPGTDKREFYGLEVLQAASAAVGAPRALGMHPNYVRFHFRGSDFPDLDELFLWLQHGVLRLQQKVCLETQLRRTVSAFLGRPRPLDEMDAARDAFGGICAAEQRLAEAWRGARHREGRHEHGRLCGWTDAFHIALLREFAGIEMLQQRRGPDAHMTRLRSVPWYYPASQDLRWTCWAIILEIAVRRMVRAALGAGVQTPDHELIWCGRGPVPTVLFASRGQAPQALSIYLAGFDPDLQLTRIGGHAVRHRSWHLAAGDALWPRGAIGPVPSGRGPAHRSAVTAPPASVIWQWASQPEAALDPGIARAWLGQRGAPAARRAS